MVMLHEEHTLIAVRMSKLSQFKLLMNVHALRFPLIISINVRQYLATRRFKRWRVGACGLWLLMPLWTLRVQFNGSAFTVESCAYSHHSPLSVFVLNFGTSRECFVTLTRSLVKRFSLTCDVDFHVRHSSRAMKLGPDLVETVWMLEGSRLILYQSF